MCDCRFSRFCAECGGLKFMVSPKGMDSANECLAQILERVYQCVQQIQ